MRTLGGCFVSIESGGAWTTESGQSCSSLPHLYFAKPIVDPGPDFLGIAPEWVTAGLKVPSNDTRWSEYASVYPR